MRIRTAAPLAVAAVIVAVSIAPADAGPRKPKPVTGTVKATLAPQPVALEACASPGQVEGVNKKSTPIKVAGKGKLDVVMSGFYGDWDMVLLNPAGAVLATGSGTNVDGNNSTPVAPIKETMKYTSKKAQTMTLVVCNFSGSPEATATYKYIYS